MKLAYIIFSYLVLFSLGIIDNSRGPVYPELLTIFSLSKTQGALIFTLTSLVSFVVTLSSRIWLKKMGVILATKMALVSFFMGCLLMGVSVNYNTGYQIFLVASLLTGIGIGVSSLTVNLLITQSTTTLNRRRVLSGLHSMYGVSALLAPSILSLFFKYKLNWVYYFYGLAFLPLGGLFLFRKLKENQQVKIESEVYEKILEKKSILVLCLIFSLYVCCEMLIATRLVLYLKIVKGFSLDEASSHLGFFFLCLLLGRVLFSLLKIKLKSKLVLKVSLLGTLLFLIAGILFNPYIFFICGLFMSVFFPCALEWVSVNFPSQSQQVLSQVMSAVGGGLVIMHFVFGYLSSHIGLDMTIYIAPSMVFIVMYLLQFHTKFLAKD